MHNVGMKIAKEDSSFPLIRRSDCISVTSHHTGPGEAVMDAEVVSPQFGACAYMFHFLLPILHILLNLHPRTPSLTSLITFGEGC